MRGRSIPYLKNWLRHHRNQAERVEAGEAVQALVEHPGWAVVEELAAVVAEHGDDNLRKIAEQTALSSDLQERIEFARKRGVQDAVGFTPDVIASILESAKTAASELRDSAALEQSGAEGT